jgi:hypothetical protein
MTLPNFLIIGAMRSGTTALARCLGQHPDVYMAPEKEVRFFDVRWREGVDSYARSFAGATCEAAIGEATPNYLYSPPAIVRAHEVLPDVKLLAILRSPTDRAYSHYWLNRLRDREPLAFEDAIEAEPTRIEHDWRTRSLYGYLDRGRYLHQLQHVSDVYPRKSLHVTIFEELRDSPAKEFSAVCRFIGVDPSVTPALLGLKVNAYYEARSKTVAHAVRRLSSQGNAGRVLADALGKLNRLERPYPPMPPDARSHLEQMFAPEIEALEAWLGQDLSCWRPSMAATEV